MKHKDLHFYLASARIKKFELARLLGVSRFQLAGLLYPDRYPVVLTDELVERLTELLNQPADYVRKYYERAAAPLPKVSGL